ncbi:MAG: F0F1 ATP synthase subunit delta [candidate division Zixibacteria bacterium]|nr:F0F1 ATP synthase subunit delta [candidate division Zixibacteria bacterium]NIR66407.1 F0F1 ATP synthase subunit delta [candidate division Zixibacteria bacterium]NIS18051.1 F0F1 ATP synthase subunit delta [candidate division Zixibacteria bacterium]NIS47997.1 F0F1 ATP synthase subunit delta [candidate division Zixibacteria bacterium]NIT54331.1 F0F1 ATP synthase subunit delta [candidate division Zixibacteria bacterium]
MISSEVAKRYAVGLFELAQEKNMIDQIADEMRSIAEVCKQDKTLLNFLAAPQIRDQDKEEVVKSVFADRVSAPVRKFLELIVEKRRSMFLVEIAEAFNDLVLESQGYLKTRVESAIELTSQESEALQKKLEEKTGKKILMTTAVKPQILGGVIVHLGSQIIDKSIQHDLRILRDRLLELKVH